MEEDSVCSKEAGYSSSCGQLYPYSEQVCRAVWRSSLRHKEPWGICDGRTSTSEQLYLPKWDQCMQVTSVTLSYTQMPTTLATACYSCGQEKRKIDRIFVSPRRCCLLCVQWDSWCIQWQGRETQEVPRCSNTVYWVSWNDYKISAILQALAHQTLSTVPSESICSPRYW